MEDEIFVKAEDFRKVLSDNFGQNIELQWVSATDSDRIYGLGEQELLIILHKIFTYKANEALMGYKTLLYDDDEMSECYCADWYENRSSMVYKKIAESLGDESRFVAMIVTNKENIDGRGIPRNGLVWITFFLGKI